jgi:hypothetical protein
MSAEKKEGARGDLNARWPRQAGKQVGRQAGRQEGRKAEKKEGRKDAASC